MPVSYCTGYNIRVRIKSWAACALSAPLNSSSKDPALVLSTSLLPAKTPRPIRIQLHSEIKKALASPHVQATLLSDGAEAVGSDPDTFQKFFASEVNKWKTVVRNAGISPE